MAAAPAGREEAVAVLSIAAGSLLLAVHFYSATRLIPSTALGVLLLLLAPVLAYAGLQRSFRKGSPLLFVPLCLMVSVLWGSYGVIHILAGQGVLQGHADLRNAAVPGLASFSLGLLLLGVVGFLQKEVALALMASSLSLACAHEIATLYDTAFGPAAMASNYMAVCLVGGYVGVGRCLFALSKGKITLAGSQLAQREASHGPRLPDSRTGTNDLTVLGFVLNMLWASVFGCQLLRVTDDLFVGQVPWLWAGGVYQLGVTIVHYRTLDVPAATFFGLTSILKFGGGYSLLILRWLPKEPAFPVPFAVVFAVLFCVLALFGMVHSLAEGLYLLFYVAFCIALACSPGGFFEGAPQGVAVAIFVASAFLTFAYLYPGKPRLRGQKVLWGLLSSRLHVCKLWEGKELHVPYLGYSRYAEAEVLGYACSVLASFAIAGAVESREPRATVVLPWVVVAGGLLKLLCGSVAFSRGKTLESSAFVLYGCMWIIWGLTRYGGLDGPARGFQVAVGIISLLLLNAFIVLCTLFLSVAWFAYSLTFQLILVSFLLDAVGATPAGLDTAVAILFGLVSFYCFLSSLVNSTFESPQLPTGRPLVRLGAFGREHTKCPHLPARKASSVKQIAEIMKQGGTCGIPTDTVYVLAAACSRPDAVEKAYSTKRHAQDRPMSLWISSLQQLEPAKHQFSPLLWDFMSAAWPSTISVVVPRGGWVDCLGMRDSAKYVGTPQSIAIRIPDCSVTTHLIDLVGPITVTSANPTGEADTTHHNQVSAKLGAKVDAVLCAGPSPENIASTVVDCTKIESGNLGFFRVGIVPKSQVLQILEQVQQKQQSPADNAALEDVKEQQELSTDALSGTHPVTQVPWSSEASYVNGAFSTEDTISSP